MRRAIFALDLLLVFLFAAVLIQPLFKARYVDRWDSIESTYIADGRMLREHAPHPQWQPLWYCGTRFDYIYPPAVRYGTALLSGIFIPARAHHVYTALLYCLGIAGVYFFARILSGSRKSGWLAAAGVALLSPAAWLIPELRSVMPRLTPWRLWVLVRYGEGPHVSAVALLPVALAFSYMALGRRRPAALACAALSCAAVALTNFYGSTALGILFPILVWSVWVTSRDRSVWLRGAAIAALAGGLSAFWLTPSYLRLTIENLKWFSPPGDRSAQILFLATAVVFAAGSWRFRARTEPRAYRVFLLGSILLLGVNVLGYRWLHIRALAEPNRLEVEFDLILVLALVELVRQLWDWSAQPGMRMRLSRALALILVLGGLWSARHYVKHAWEGYLYPLDPDYRQRVEYRMSDWVSGHLPQSRTFATGSVRFWWNAWHDTAQVGGGCDRGVLNQFLMPAMYQVTVGTDPETAVRWLTALGVDAVIVSDARSQEMYHDFQHPAKFAGVLPVLYDDGLGNVIYRVPRRYPSLARVVDTAALGAVAPGWESTDVGALRRYTAVIEQGPDAPAPGAWEGTDAMRIHARVAPGQSVVVQNTFDPAWHAYVGTRELRVRPDPLSFTAIEAPPGDDDIRLVFETPLENRIGWLFTWLSLAVVAGLLALNYVHRQSAE
ncbi:MAG: hypothetical protein ABSC93_31845 [Bryobacteraceae bacterium]